MRVSSTAKLAPKRWVFFFCYFFFLHGMDKPNMDDKEQSWERHADGQREAPGDDAD